MASNYFIDLSKKGYLSFNGSNINPGQDTAAGISRWSFMGDLNTDFLKDFSLVYTEDFTDYSAQLNKKFEDLTKAVQSVIGAMFKAKFNINAPELRGKLLEAEILISYFKSNKEAETDSDSKGNNPPWKISKETDISKNSDLYERLKDIVESYNKISMYRIPARKSIPHIAIGKAELPITFNFAFGKCNLFDAKQEVWIPMTNLYNALVNVNMSEIKGGIDGQLNATTKGAIPYTNFAFAEILDTIRGSKYNRVDINKAVKALMDSKSSIESESSDKDKLKEYLEAEFSKIEGDMKDVNLNNKNLKKLVKKGAAGDDATMVKSMSSELFAWYKSKFGGVRGDYESRKKNIINLVDNDNEMVVSLPENKSGDKLTDFKIEWPTESSTDRLNNISNVLRDIATFDMDTIHQSLSNAYKRIVSEGNGAFYLHAGYKPYFKHSLGALGDECGTEANHNNEPLIIYGPFVPKKVVAKFDFKNLDRDGYPMSGSIEITPWNLKISNFGMKVKGINKY